MVIVSRKSMISGEVNDMTLPLSPEEYLSCAQKWRDGTLIQNAFPMLNATQREFIKTGITEKEWANMFNDCEEEDGEEEPAQV